MLLFLLAVGVLFAKGLGIWGLRTPAMWAWAITNFVWWVGIGHAGTLISAILLLLNQQWRNSINRFAEAMTLFAVACAGMFPVLHLGRPWLMYWLFPYPNTMGIEPNFRSPLVWDVFAVSTYATVSLLFWYVGLMPDLATLRDRSEHRALKLTYGIPGDGLARFGQALGGLRNGVAAARRAWRRRWCSRCTRWSASTSPSASSPDGTARSSRPTSWRARFIRASPWCWRWPFRCAPSTDCKG